MANLIERAKGRIREWKIMHDPNQGPLAFALSEYKKNGGITLGAEGETYRLKVTPDDMELISMNNNQPIDDVEAEKKRAQEWAQNYGIQAWMVQRYMRIALGLPPEIPEKPNDQK